MKEFSYKKVTTTKLQAIGEFNSTEGTIEVEGVTKKLTDLFKDFNGEIVTLAIQIKSEEDVEETEEV